MSTIMEEIKERFRILEDQYDLYPQVKDDFLENDELYRSENFYLGPGPVGALFKLSPEEKELVKKIEADHMIKVYHVIKNQCLYSFLYVSQYEEEWDNDKTDLKNGYPLIYCYNTNDEFCSEFGSISITNGFGGIVRNG